ncbi:MAG: hypothetical protein ACOCXZ_01690 [Chloroflexota bacterium]
MLVAGVFTGSALWWLTLSTRIYLVRSRFSIRWLAWVNRFSGMLILFFALAILLRVII